MEQVVLVERANAKDESDAKIREKNLFLLFLAPYSFFSVHFRPCALTDTCLFQLTKSCIVFSSKHILIWFLCCGNFLTKSIIIIEYHHSVFFCRHNNYNNIHLKVHAINTNNKHKKQCSTGVFKHKFNFLSDCQTYK